MIKCENACPRGKFDGCCHKCPDFHTCPDSCQENPNACGSATFDEETALQEFKNTQLATLNAIASLTAHKKAIEEQEKEMKAKLYEAMVKFGVDKFESDVLNLTLEETITKIIDLEAKINARIDELVSMKQEAFTMINRIPDLDQQNILIGRYIQLKKWEDISEELNYSMQWVFELHGKGLLAFAKANSDFLNNRENQSTTGSKQSKESVE